MAYWSEAAFRGQFRAHLDRPGRFANPAFITVGAPEWLSVRALSRQLRPCR